MLFALQTQIQILQIQLQIQIQISATVVFPLQLLLSLSTTCFASQFPPCATLYKQSHNDFYCLCLICFCLIYFCALYLCLRISKHICCKLLPVIFKTIVKIKFSKFRLKTMFAKMPSFADRKQAKQFLQKRMRNLLD